MDSEPVEQVMLTQALLPPGEKRPDVHWRHPSVAEEEPILIEPAPAAQLIAEHALVPPAEYCPGLH